MLITFRFNNILQKKSKFDIFTILFHKINVFFHLRLIKCISLTLILLSEKKIEVIIKINTLQQQLQQQVNL